VTVGRAVRALVVCAIASTSCSRTEPLDLDADGDGRADVNPRRSGPNECGGRGALEATPGVRCGVCGVFACAGPERVVCDDRELRNACGGCGPPPEEECNGRDDDCDGLVDERCLLRLGPPEEGTESVRLSGARAVLSVPLVVTLPGGAVRDFRTPPPPPDAGTYGYDGTASLDGDLVAWVRRGGPPSLARLMAHDFRTGRTFDSAEPGYYISSLAVDGDRVAFEIHRDDVEGAVDVWIWDLATNTTRNVTLAGANETTPDLSGEWLVYERAPPRDSSTPTQVVAQNLRTGERVVVSDGTPGWHRAPAIDGTRIVWNSGDGVNTQPSDGQIFLYDLATRTRRTLTRRGSRFRPRISGTLVCWAASPTEPPYSSMGDVTVFDLVTERSVVITTRGQLCDISGRRVAVLEWFDWNGRTRAYYRDLLPGEP